MADEGITIIKCMLHISADEQKERLLARLDDPTKHWKYNPGDLDERAHWAVVPRGLRDRARAHQHRVRARGTSSPSDRKWYRNLAIGNLLHDTLTNMNPQWPAADFDVDEQKRRLVDEPLT